MHRSCLTCALVLLPLTLAAQQPRQVHDGEQMTLQGTLTMSPLGRLQFVTVATAEAYLPVWIDDRGEKTLGETVHGIGLSVPLPYAELYAHKGERVTVQGKLGVDGISPYFWFATRLDVASLRLQDGTELVKPAPARIAPPETLQRYSAVATLPTDLAAPWQYRVTSTTVPAGHEREYLACRSNGGGDVVNCSCADGFHPTAATATVNNQTTDGTLYDFAQFSVGDPDQESATDTSLFLTCSR